MHKNNMRFVGFGIFLRWGLFGVLLSTNCFAQMSGNLTGVTNYIWRGYTKSDNQPALQGNVDYEFKSGFYLGSFVSSVNFSDHNYADRSRLEFRPYAGYSYKLSDDWRFNVEWNRYIYDGKIFGQNVDYNDFYFYGHFRDFLTASIAVSENSYQQNHMSFNHEITARYPITDSIEFSSTAGYNKQKKNLSYDYFYWTTGVTLHFSRHIGMDFRYYGATHTAERREESLHWQFHPDAVGNRVVFSITAGF